MWLHSGVVRNRKRCITFVSFILFHVLIQVGCNSALWVNFHYSMKFPLFASANEKKNDNNHSNDSGHYDRIIHEKSLLMSVPALENLKPLELYDKMSYLFERIDKDNSMVLEPNELDNWFSIMDWGVASILVDFEIKESDEDKNGYLTILEFKYGPFASDKDTKLVEEIFLELDTNMDGALSIAELTVLFTTQSVPPLLNLNTEQLFQQLDNNDDGFLTCEEAVKHPEGISKLEKALIKDIDTNKNGYIEVDEAQKGFVRYARLRFDMFFESIGINSLAGVTTDQWSDRHIAIAVSPLTFSGLLFQYPSYFDKKATDHKVETQNVVSDEL